MNNKLFQKIAARVPDDETAVLRLWSELKAADDGVGQVLVPKSRSEAIERGNGRFWQVDEVNGRLFLFSPKRVLASMEMEAG